MNTRKAQKICTYCGILKYSKNQVRKALDITLRDLPPDVRVEVKRECIYAVYGGIKRWRESETYLPFQDAVRIGTILTQ